jgi:hypothetical protein
LLFRARTRHHATPDDCN